MSEAKPHLSIGDIERLARGRGTAVLWLDDSGTKSWADFADGFERASLCCDSAGVQPGDVVVTPASQQFSDLTWLFGAAARGGVVAPVRPERSVDADAWAEWFEVRWRVGGDGLVRGKPGETSPSAARLFAVLRKSRNPGLILATGGTTGKPKVVLHDLAALLATVPIRAREGMRVLPLMRFDHIGGLDMAWRAMAGGDVIVAPPREITPDSVGAAVERHRVEVMPATPSLLNLLLVAGIHRSHDLASLKIIPYGAEPMPDSLLARLRTAFPRVHFVQRFGTSETGSLPVRGTASGLELHRGGTGFEWMVVNNELCIRSPARALGYLTGEAGGFTADGWYRTGDIAEEMPDGGIVVRGRRQDVINMGGEKILPSEVEDIILSHPLVEECRVFASPNALLGQVVAADIVWTGEDRSPVAVKRALRDHVPDEYARRKLPTVVRLVESIAFTGNQKKSRITVP